MEDCALELRHTLRGSSQEGYQPNPLPEQESRPACHATKT